MKKIRLLTLCLTFICLLSLFSCADTEAPEVPSSVEVEYETLTLKWDGVAGARIYTVRIERAGGESREVDVSRTYYSLEALEAGEYKLSVRAVGGGAGSGSLYSAPVDFVKDPEYGLIFNLTDGGEYEVAGRTDASGVIEIPRTYRQKPVTAIGEQAFFNSAEIKEVVLHDGIKRIGAFAFSGCSYLERAELPAGLTELGESCFSGCRMLGGELILPDTLKAIPDGAFAYCSALEGVRIGDGVGSIGKNAFTDCSGIKSVTLPEGLEVIGGFAFAACADITEIKFPSSLTEIGEFAFSKALSLTEITVPDGVRVIGKGAFYYCSSLASAELGDGLCELGDSAFLDTAIYKSSPTNEIYVDDWLVGLVDTSAISLDVRVGTVGIANAALYGNKNIGAVELPDSVRYIGESAFAASNIISIVTGGGVEHIANQAFLYCERLIDVALGSYDYTDMAIRYSSLTSIGDYAFMNCKKLARIDIPDTVRDIGAYAFRNTEMYSSALTGAVYADNWIVDFNKTVTDSVVVDRGTVGIARYAFYNCTGLKNIKIDGSVEVIGKGAFYNCTSLERVTFPDTLERIEDYTFYNCSSLRLTSLPPMLREIGRSAFYACGTADAGVGESDEDVLEIPGGVTYVGDYAFFGCGYRRADSVSGVTETAGIDVIRMGDRIEYIGKGAFRGFASLKSVVIAGADMIGDRAFYGCPSLLEVTVGSRLSRIGKSTFSGCSALLRASFPDTLLEIGNFAFSGCGSLEKVDTGTGLAIIGDCAFSGDVRLCALMLPDSVVAIGDGAFRECIALGSLALGDNIESVGAHAFYGAAELTLYVENATRVSTWSPDWNSSYLPVVYGCEVSCDGYVLSVAGQDTDNLFSDTVLAAPVRDGYEFLGWSTTEGGSVEYGQSELISGGGARPLYAVYGEKTDR